MSVNAVKISHALQSARVFLVHGAQCGAWGGDSRSQRLAATLNESTRNRTFTRREIFTVHYFSRVIPLT